jgi:DNA-binding GntR family transcriptional regulator
MIERRNEDILTSIEDDIIFGRLPPGTRLTEDGLMARFGVTRHFIRQTLVELERVGIVVRERNVGATVRHYAPAEVRQIYEVRELLQRQAALMIPLPASAALVLRLQALNDAFRRAHEVGDLRAVHEANDAFHLELFGACSNQYLVRSIREYMALSLPMRANSLADPEAFRVSEGQHRIMIALLQDTDRWALAQICVDHVQPSKQAYLDHALGPAHSSAGG